MPNIVVVNMMHICPVIAMYHLLNKLHKLNEVITRVLYNCEILCRSDERKIIEISFDEGHHCYVCNCY